MNSERENTQAEFFNCCQDMDFAEMMRNMMNQRGEELDSHCVEMIQKMRAQESGCCDFDCSEMMQKMMTMCDRSGQEKEETTEKA